jgi:LuxR family transcriptional regulator, quorum-sensing system regulator CviR
VLLDFLDIEQRLALIELIDALSAVDTSDKFTACMSGEMQRLLPHEWFICSVGRIGRNGIEPIRVVTHRFPEELFALISGPDHKIIDNPVLSRWWETRTPVAINFDDCNGFWPRVMTERATKFDARNLLGHGQIDVRGEFVTYFSFHRIPERIGRKQGLLLGCIVPNLTAAFARAHVSSESDATVKNLADGRSGKLTPRQIEILGWLREGKTNWEISMILGMSVDNVKYHVKQITRKLQVTNRIQAVAATSLRTVI